MKDIIQFDCPTCNKHWRVAGEHAGKLINCKCGNPITVPNSQASASDTTPQLSPTPGTTSLEERLDAISITLHQLVDVISGMQAAVVSMVQVVQSFEANADERANRLCEEIIGGFSAMTQFINTTNENIHAGDNAILQCLGSRKMEWR